MNHRDAYILHHFSLLQCVVFWSIHPADAALEVCSALWLEGGGQRLRFTYLLVFSHGNTILTSTHPHP